MGRNSTLSHEQKLEVVKKHRHGWKPFAILKDIQDTNRNVTIKNVRYIVNAYQTGSFSDVIQCEAKTKDFKDLDGGHIQCIKDTLTAEPTSSVTDLGTVLSENCADFSKSTIRRAIKSAGWTSAKPRYCQMIRDANKVKRAEFCQQLIQDNESFDDVIFTDESTIQLHDNKSTSYRPINGLASHRCRPKHPLKVHLWGGISRKGKTPLLIFEGIMEKTFYTDQILRNALLPFVERKFPNGHRLMQDNDPKHTSLYAREFMTTNGINWWKWPAESCDLNPIEMVWNMLKRDVAKREPRTKNELIRYVREFWNEKLSREVCSTYIDHIFKVVPVVKAIDGRASGNLPKKLFREPSRGRSIAYFQQQLLCAETQKLLQGSNV